MTGRAVRVLSIKRKGFVLIAVPLLFQLFVLLLLVTLERRHRDDAQRDLRARDLVANAYRLLGLVVDSETGLRGYILTRNPIFTEPLDKARQHIPGTMQKLRDLARDGTARADLRQVERTAAVALATQDANRQLVDSGRGDEAFQGTAALESKQRMDAFRGAMGHFLNERERWQRVHAEASARSQRTLRMAVVGAVIADVLVALALARFFTREISRRLFTLTENTRLVEAGEALHAPMEGNDELAELDSRLHAMAERIERSKYELGATNQELESFSYSVSHDLRAPLRAVDGYARMLEEDAYEKLDKEGRRYLATIRAEARRMGQLIDDLLSFSRISRQGLTVGPVDMNGLVAEAVNAARMDATGDVDVVTEDLPRATGDRALLFQVVLNLLANAIKFSAKNDTPRVEVGARLWQDEQIYWVRDNGAGFDMRFAGKLFGVFQRLHSGSEFQGTGVGLAIVHRIITRHGGRVWAEGEVGRGATFYFALPIGKEPVNG